MKNLKSTLISYLLPLIAVSFAYNKSNDSHYLCKQQYALCTSALCIPEPDNPARAICFCDVEEGESMATVPCGSIKPSTDADGIRTVYSTFSLKQLMSGKRGMKCPAGTPWTWCLNKRCTVDPSNPKRAICVCDVMLKNEWTTLGGNCDTSTCQTGYWSGAPLSDFNDGIAFLAKALGLAEPPAKWCEANP